MEIRTAEDVHQFLAELDRTQPLEDPHELREREFQRRKERDQRERERREREARKAEEKRQTVASTDWYAAVDTRVRTHFKDWAWAAIDERIHEHLERFTKMYNEDAGEVIGKIGARTRTECKAAIVELMDEVGARFAALEKRLVSNEATGGAQVRAQRDEFTRAIEAAQRAFETTLAEQNEKLREEFRVGIGRLPIAKTWDPDEVCYRGDVVICDGAVFQALKDTGKPPAADHSDWIMLARRGRDAPLLNFRGQLNAYEKYRPLDVVEFDGSSFVATRDLNPGTLPGEDGWQLLCRLGGRGPAGEVGPRGRKGERGARGAGAPTINFWTIDRQRYRAIPTLSNATTGATLELRPLFEQFCDEGVIAAAVDAALKDATRTNPSLLAPL